MAIRRTRFYSSSYLMAPLLVVFIFLKTPKTTLAKPLPRIIGGQDATAGSYPFFASLTMGGSHSCGGTLIAPDIILSAAHCQNLQQAEVGRSIRTDPNDNFETFNFIQEIRHPVYDNEQYKYDFMILQLDRPASDQFKPIRLNQNESLPEIGVAEGVKAIGFGVTEYFYDGTHSGPAERLQEVGLKVITNEQCMLATGTETTDEAYANGYAGLITPDMLCAEDDRQDTCLGDSGGPLMIQQWDEYIQVGITSWGFGCGDNTFPGVYSRVSNQFIWIRKQVCDLSVNPPAEFECDAPTLPPAKVVQVTLAVTFDDFPDEITMMITDESGFGVNLVINSFTDVDPQSTFYHTLNMKERSTYTFIINDSGGDGLCCYVEGSYVIYVGTETDRGEILVEGGGNFGEEMVHQFTVPTLGESKSDPSATIPPVAPSPFTQQNASLAPTQTPTMTLTTPPTVPPTSTPTLAPSGSPTVTTSPTLSPSRFPTKRPSSSPTESMAPSHVPTTVPQPKNITHRSSIIFGVFIVIIVAGLFLVTSWYADSHTRMHKAQTVVPLVEAAKEFEDNRQVPSRKA